MKKRVFLVQTDTTAGFLSKSEDRLADVKQRPKNKPFLFAVSSLKELKNRVRVPKKHRKAVRKSERSTFIYNKTTAIRVVKNSKHSRFLNRFGSFYSSSANLSGEGFEIGYAKEFADLICEDSRGLFESGSSQIIELGRYKRRRLR